MWAIKKWYTKHPWRLATTFSSMSHWNDKENHVLLLGKLAFIIHFFTFHMYKMRDLLLFFPFIGITFGLQANCIFEGVGSGEVVGEIILTETETPDGGTEVR